MTNRFFTVPCDSGHKDLRMGAGPARLANELGVTAEQVEPIRIAAPGLASYDPSFDTSGAIAKAGARFVQAAR